MQAQTVLSPDVPAIFTPWTTEQEGEQDQLNAMRDQLFRMRAVEVMQEQAPWLPPILKAANAVISVRPGQFDVVVPGDPNPVVVTIPWLGALLVLLPWVEANETAQ